MNTTFSVIIATYRRPRLLGRSLESVLRQAYPEGRYEVIVVDNAEERGAEGQVNELAGRSPVPLSYCHEPRQGLSSARNRAIRQARFDYVAYLDDDASAEEGWLAAFDGTIRERGADIVGGRVVPVPEGVDAFPPWFDSPYVRGFFGLDYREWGFEDKVFRIEYPLYLGGGNSCIRRSLFRLGWVRYESELGRRPGRHFQGEETLLNFLLEKAGYGIYYNGEAVVRHHIERRRLEKRDILRKAFWGGYSDAWMHRRMFGRRYVLRGALGAIRKNMERFSKRPPGEAGLFERRCLAAHDAGYLLRAAVIWPTA